MTVFRNLLAICLVFTATAAGAQEGPLLTAPERTDFRETTRYAEVQEFMAEVAERSPLIHLTTFGYSLEGRRLPLAVVGHVENASAEAVRASGKTVVYLQGGIHSGEVEGKEVLLMFLREVSEGQHLALLDSLVILVGPLFNPDGGERVTLTNRGAQHGPIGGTGTRPNAQGLNINRDHTKLVSPEARSLALLYQEYDPHVAVDLHTTNGTQHAYHLTYSPPLHPATDSEVSGILTDRLLPELTANVRRDLGWEFYYYGNVQGQGEARGWYTFDHRPRFSNNYYGLRNRLGLLSEAYSYATFEDRIIATRHFVEEILGFAKTHASEIRALTARADARSIVGQTLPVRATYARAAEPVEILMGATVEERNPYSGARMLRRVDVRRPEVMADYTTFEATAEEVVPSAYLVPAELAIVLDNLATHGVRMEEVEATRTLTVERFAIASMTRANMEFEGVRELTLTGSWRAETAEVPAGSWRVEMNQPLARLIFLLLEPRSDDGLVNWGRLDPQLSEGTESYPILRVR